MWFFMITCYIMTALSFLLLAVTGLQGYLQFPVLKATHSMFALLTVMVYLFTETLVIFFFVGVGVSIRDYLKEKNLGGDFQKRSFKVKMKVYPPLLLSIGLVMVLFISGGAVDTRHIPAWSHGLLFFVTMLQFMDAIRIQHSCFRDMTNIVLEMSGITPRKIV